MYSFYHHYQFVIRIVGSALLACLLWSAPVRAHHTPYDSGSGSLSGGFNPSISTPGYNQYQRQQEQQDTQRSYGYQQAPSEPRSSNPYNFPTPSYGPNGKMTLCQEGFNGARYCR